jgi:peptidoglycan L-alanyl-D-glutamate endopeptidase CwlK
MATRSLTALHPTVHRLCNRHITACQQSGIDLLVTCTLRSGDEQNALYAQGRQPLDVVNGLRTVLGLAPITEKENSRTVTDARGGYSFHQYGLAYDVVPLESGKPAWDEHAGIWSRVGAIGEQCGLEWAGKWVHRTEYPHFQWSGGLSLANLLAGRMPAEGQV